MAVIDFPSSPTMGQEYAFGDFIYVWDGVKWTTKVIVGNVPGGGGSTTYVSETAPVGADPGSTWFCTANGLTYILYADVDSIQWVEANPNYPQVDMGTGSSGGSQTYVGENAPVGAPEGSTWYCTSNGITYLLLNDGDSSQWVESNPNTSGGAGFVKKTGDTMTGPLEQRTANGVGTSLTSGDGIADLNWNDYAATTRYKIRYDVSVAKWGLHNYDNTGTWSSTLISHLGAEPEGVYVHRPRSSTDQETDPAALTRKDYVDSAINTANLIADIRSIPDGSDVLDYFKTHPHEAFCNMGSNGVNLPTGWSYGNIHWLLHGLETDGTAKFGTLMMYDCGGEIFVNFLNNGTWVGWREFTTAAPATHMEARVNDLEATVASLMARIETLEGGA